MLARACLRSATLMRTAWEKAMNACVSERNSMPAAINWRFTTKHARAKLRRLYPDTSALP